MEFYDSEESCSSVSSSSSVFYASVDSQESSVDSYPRLPSNNVLKKKRNRKRAPHILDKLYYREVRFIPSFRYSVLWLVLLTTTHCNCCGFADQGYLCLSAPCSKFKAFLSSAIPLPDSPSKCASRICS